jgi:hypothetical protein
MRGGIRLRGRRRRKPRLTLTHACTHTTHTQTHTRARARLLELAVAFTINAVAFAPKPFTFMARTCYYSPSCKPNVELCLLLVPVPTSADPNPLRWISRVAHLRVPSSEKDEKAPNKRVNAEAEIAKGAKGNALCDAVDPALFARVQVLSAACAGMDVAFPVVDTLSWARRVSSRLFWRRMRSLRMPVNSSSLATPIPTPAGSAL